MSGCSSEEAQSFDWESQSGLESNSDRDLGYLSERDSESTPAPKTEPAFTVIEIADLETIQARRSLQHSIELNKLSDGLQGLPITSCRPT